MKSKQILSKTTLDIQYVQRYFFMKEGNTQNSWTFDLRTQKVTDVPIWIKVGLERRDRQDSKKLLDLH